MRPLVIVGECNPFGADPSFALYHLPRGSSGNRLREIMGLPDHVYAKLNKINLCTGRWSIVAARCRVAELHPERRYLLLGAKVRSAFEGPAPFDLEVRGEATLLGIPHPSGLNRVWLEIGTRERARAALRGFAPEIEWGA